MVITDATKLKGYLMEHSKEFTAGKDANILIVLVDYDY